MRTAEWGGGRQLLSKGSAVGTCSDRELVTAGGGVADRSCDALHLIGALLRWARTLTNRKGCAASFSPFRRL